MAISPLGAIGPASVSGAGSVPAPTKSFQSIIKGQLPPSEGGRIAAQPTEAKTVDRAAPCRVEVAPAQPSSTTAPHVVAGRMFERVQAAQARMDSILDLAQSGKAFSPAELLSLQANVYRASQELDLAGKVVEKATGGVKQVLQTQV